MTNEKLTTNYDEDDVKYLKKETLSDKRERDDFSVGYIYREKYVKEFIKDILDELDKYGEWEDFKDYIKQRAGGNLA